MSPAVVIEHIRDWDGEIVTVEGWLGACEGHDCLIHSTVSDMQTVQRSDSRSDEWLEAISRSISIGATDSFDAAALPLQHSYVRLKARVNDECWPARCSDRAPILEPISIEAVSLPEKAD